MKRWVLGGALVVLILPAYAGASQWPLAGGDASRSGSQGTAPAETPFAPIWARGDAGIRTPVVITGGLGPGVQRVAYGTTGGAVHLQVLESGSAVGPEDGIPIVNTAVDSDLTDTFGTGAIAAGFASTSTADRLGVLYVVHNDGQGVEIARIDEATGARVDGTDPPVASSINCHVNGSPVLSPPSASGSRLLFVLLKGGACPGDQTLVRIPIDGDAASPSATLGPAGFARLSGLEDGVGPTLVVLTGADGRPHFYAAVGRDGGVDFYLSDRALEGAPPATTTAPDLTVTLPAAETAMTVGAPATAAGLVAGAEGAGTPPAPALYVAADTGGGTKIYRLVQPEPGKVQIDRTAGPLPNAAGPAPALAVAETMTPSGPSPGGRLVVTTAQNLTVLRTSDLGTVAQLSAAPLGAGQGFARTVAAVSGSYGFATRDGSASVPAEHVAVRLDSGARLSGADFGPASGNGNGATAGQPAIARGVVVIASATGVFAYGSRDATGPSVDVVAPAAGAKLSGMAPVAADAADDRGVSGVTFRLVGGGATRTLGKATASESGSAFGAGARFSITADLTSVPAGAYEIEAVATDPTGNTSVSAGRAVTVAAQGPGPPPGSCSNLVLGTARADHLRGTEEGDRIVGGNGNDRLSGGGGHDCVLGEAGADRLEGGSGNDELEGGSGGDRLAGGSGRDEVAGGAGNDRLSGGSGRNRLSGGSGRDRISARNRARDSIRCGAGRDVVTADRTDKVARDCERVKRPRRR